MAKFVIRSAMSSFNIGGADVKGQEKLLPIVASISRGKLGVGDGMVAADEVDLASFGPCVPGCLCCIVWSSGWRIRATEDVWLLSVYFGCIL